MRSPDFLSRGGRGRRRSSAALAIGAAAAEGRALGEYLAVVLVLAARPVISAASLRGCSCQAVRPSGADAGGRISGGRIGRSSRDRENRGRSSPPRLVARLVVARLVEARLVEIRAPSRGGRELRRHDRAQSIALLPWLGIAACGRSPKSLRGPGRPGARSGATREFLVAAEFSLGPSPSRDGRDYGRSPWGRSPSLRKPSPRGVYGRFSPSYLAAYRAFCRRISFRKSRRRAGIVAVAARRTVVAVVVRAIAARRVRALFAATIIARLERAFAVTRGESRGGSADRRGTVVPIEARRTRRSPSRPRLAGVGLAAARIRLLA